MQHVDIVAFDPDKHTSAVNLWRQRRGMTPNPTGWLPCKAPGEHGFVAVYEGQPVAYCSLVTHGLHAELDNLTSDSTFNKDIEQDCIDAVLKQALTVAKQLNVRWVTSFTQYSYVAQRALESFGAQLEDKLYARLHTEFERNEQCQPQ